MEAQEYNPFEDVLTNLCKDSHEWEKEFAALEHVMEKYPDMCAQLRLLRERLRPLVQADGTLRLTAADLEQTIKQPARSVVEAPVVAALRVTMRRLSR